MRRTFVLKSIEIGKNSRASEISIFAIVKDCFFISIPGNGAKKSKRVRILYPNYVFHRWRYLVAFYVVWIDLINEDSLEESGIHIAAKISNLHKSYFFMACALILRNICTIAARTSKLAADYVWHHSTNDTKSNIVDSADWATTLILNVSADTSTRMGHSPLWIRDWGRKSNGSLSISIEYGD